MVNENIDPLWVYTFFLYYFRILFFLIPQTVFTFRVLPFLVLAHFVFALSWLFIYVAPPPKGVPVPQNLFHLLVLVGLESLLGFVLGFFVRLIFVLFILFGEIVNLHTGLAMANLMVPGIGSVGIFGNLFRVIGGLLFFLMGGLEITFYGLKLSFETVPVGTFNPFVLDFKVFTLLLVKVIAIALAMAMPVIAIYIIVNLILALTNRLVPNVNIFFVGYPIYMLANFAVIALLTPGLVYTGNRFIENYLKLFVEFVKNLS